MPATRSGTRSRTCHDFHSVNAGTYAPESRLFSDSTHWLRLQDIVPPAGVAVILIGVLIAPQ
jgi:hypothetical protein